MLSRIRALWATEPARVVYVLTAIVVFVAAKAGVVLDEQSVGEALLLILPILVGGEATRKKVSPATGPVGTDSDALLPVDAIENIDREEMV